MPCRVEAIPRCAVSVFRTRISHRVLQTTGGVRLVRKFLIAAVAAVTVVAGFSVLASADNGQQGTSWTFKFIERQGLPRRRQQQHHRAGQGRRQGHGREDDDRYVAPAKSVIKFPSRQRDRHRCAQGVQGLGQRRPDRQGQVPRQHEDRQPAWPTRCSGRAPRARARSSSLRSTRSTARTRSCSTCKPCAEGTGPGKPEPCKPLTARHGRARGQVDEDHDSADPDGPDAAQPAARRRDHHAVPAEDR